MGTGAASPTAVLNAAKEVLARSLGPGQWIEAIDEFYISLNLEALGSRHVVRARAEAVAAEAATRVPGVAAAFTRSQLSTQNLQSNPLTQKVLNSFHLKRGGDIFIVFEPFAVPVPPDQATTHGAPWSYDVQVPLVLWGGRFRPGTYTTPCEPIDLVATLAVTLGITQPSGTQGQPLSAGLR